MWKQSYVMALLTYTFTKLIKLYQKELLFRHEYHQLMNTCKNRKKVYTRSSNMATLSIFLKALSNFLQMWFDIKIYSVFHLILKISLSANIYLFKVNNRNTRKMCKICSKLTIKTLQQHSWHRSNIFIVTLNIF